MLKIENMNEEEFYIWDAEAFPNPEEFTPRSMDGEEVDKIVGKIGKHAPLKENKKFLEMAEYVHNFLQDEHDLSDDLNVVFQYILEQVASQIKENGYTFVELEKPHGNIADYHLLFSRICRKLGLVFVDFIPEIDKTFVFLPNGETYPEGLNDRLEEYAEEIKQREMPKGELPYKLAKTKKYCIPLFEEYLKQYDFQYQKNEALGAGEEFVKYTDYGKIVCTIDIGGGSGEYRVLYCLEVHLNEIDRFANQFECLNESDKADCWVYDIQEVEHFIRKKEIIYDFIEQKFIPSLEKVLSISTVKNIEQYLLGYTGNQPPLHKSESLYLKRQSHTVESAISYLVLSRLTCNPAYETLKKELLPLTNAMRLNTSSELHDKLRKDWNKLIQQLDALN